MATKEKFIVKKTENVDLNLYAVRNAEGKWYRSRGINGYGNSWVDEFRKAKIYSSPGPAKSQVTFWATRYPAFGVPDLVQITTGVCNYLDQAERVKKIVSHKKEISDLKREIRSNEWAINNYSQKKLLDTRYVDQMKIDTEELRTKLRELEK